MSKIVIIDTETSGLVAKGLHYSTDFDKFPFLVEVGWQLCDEDGETEIKESRIIKPDGYIIPEEVVKIHGISTEQAHDEGTDLKTVLRLLVTDCFKADKLILHNSYFDISIIKANLLRLGIDKEIGNKAFDKTKRVDTMLKTIKFVEARYANGRKGKFPKLTELYFKLFNEEMPELHRAGNDVEMLKKCYFELIKLNIIN